MLITLAAALPASAAEPYEVAVQTDVMVAMRDGVDAIARGSGELAPRAKELLALIARLGEW